MAPGAGPGMGMARCGVWAFQMTRQDEAPYDLRQSYLSLSWPLGSLTAYPLFPASPGGPRRRPSVAIQPLGVGVGVIMVWLCPPSCMVSNPENSS